MTIAILYESHEWSNEALRELLIEKEIDAVLIDVENEKGVDLSGYEMIVNRVFPSAWSRGHNQAYGNAKEMLERIRDKAIMQINSENAFYYDFDKKATFEVLDREGISIPLDYQWPEMAGGKAIEYPCIVKPITGGRSLETQIINDRRELETFFETRDPSKFVVQEYQDPIMGFTTRIEMVGTEFTSIFKRSLGDGHIGSYSRGSSYIPYPECSKVILKECRRALDVLDMEMGSLDVIENDNGFFIIDVNATSNVAEENTETFGFNLMAVMADYIAKVYTGLTGDR